MGHVSDDEPVDQDDFDPRWEVQPELDGDDEPGGHRRWTAIGLALIAVIAALVGWLLLDATPVL